MDGASDSGSTLGTAQSCLLVISEVPMPSPRQSIVFLALALVSVASARAEDVFVAAAASMSHPVEEIIDVFERETGHTVRLTLGSSGNFYGQIVNGAPFDVFLSADRNYVDRLATEGLVEPGSLELYAVGRIVVWTRADSGFAPEENGMATLLDPGVRHIAIANPRLAPYGMAAMDAMNYYAVYNGVASRLVRGDNISQAAQFVFSGAAQIGILALSQARAEAMNDGVYWEVPAEAHNPIEQAMAIVARAREPGHLDAVRAFRNAVRGSLGRSILEKYGFSVP